MNLDDEWAYARLIEHELEECASVRVTIDRITHRALNADSAGWHTLCRSHRLIVFAGRAFAVVGLPTRTYDFSASDVDCLCCLPAGG